jgi:Ala-tRNA(Pro) deacylase
MQDAAEKMDIEEEMPTSPEQLFAYLEDLEIAYDLHHHEATFKVEQSKHLKNHIEGLHCRNLFLRDKKKVMYLVVASNDTKIDLKKLDKLVGANRFSFGSADRLWQYLGVRPGSVCPYAVINDKDCAVNVILDKAMQTDEKVNYHPLVNTMTISVAFDDLVKFMKSCGHNPRIVDLTPAAPDEN